MQDNRSRNDVCSSKKVKGLSRLKRLHAFGIREVSGGSCAVWNAAVASHQLLCVCVGRQGAGSVDDGLRGFRPSSCLSALVCRSSGRFVRRFLCCFPAFSCRWRFCLYRLDLIDLI